MGLRERMTWECELCGQRVVASTLRWQRTSGHGGRWLCDTCWRDEAITYSRPRFVYKDYTNSSR